MSFSFIIPVHNGMPYLKECVKSILAQSCADFEIIILENKSTDGTAEYLRTLAAHPKIKIIPSEKLLSIEDNWKRILTVPKRPYMIITGADDSYEKDYLVSIKQMIEKHPQCSIYRTNMNMIDKDSRKTAKSVIAEKINIYTYLTGRLRHTYFETMAGYTIRSKDYEAIDGIDCVHRLMHTDDKLIMQLISNSYMAVSPEHNANYRAHAGSESGTPNQEESLKGFFYFFRWIASTKDSELIRIVKDNLPFHLKQIVRFFKPEVLERHKEIYSLFNISPNTVKDIHICLASDNNYVPFMTTAMVSALKSADEDELLHFYILCDHISRKEKDTISQLKEIKKCEIHFIDMNIDLFNDFPSGGSHISNVTYFRYKIPELFPQIDKIIWLDCDTIVKNSLWELYSTDLTHSPLAAVEDVGYTYWRTKIPHFWHTGFYINAGVMLINCRIWRQEHAGKMLMEYTEKHAADISIGDQDVINAVFKGRIKELDFKWNVQDSFLRAYPERNFNPRKEDIKMAATRPCIIHYTSERKPWNRRKCALNKEWFRYNSLAPKAYRKSRLLIQLFDHKFWKFFGVQFKRAL